MTGRAARRVLPGAVLAEEPFRALAGLWGGILRVCAHLHLRSCAFTGSLAQLQLLGPVLTDDSPKPNVVCFYGIRGRVCANWFLE